MLTVFRCQALLTCERGACLTHLLCLYKKLCKHTTYHYNKVRVFTYFKLIGSKWFFGTTNNIQRSRPPIFVL